MNLPRLGASFLWIGAALLAGCGRQPSTPPAVPPAAERSTAPAAPQITATSAGPFRIGMTRAEIEAVPNMTTVPIERKLGGKTVKLISVMQYGLPMVVAELDGDRVVSLQAMGETYLGPGGVRVGLKAVQVEQLMGPGEVERGPVGAIVTFAKTPDLRYRFSSRKAGQRDWASLVREGSRLEAILLQPSRETGAR